MLRRSTGLFFVCLAVVGFARLARSAPIVQTVNEYGDSEWVNGDTRFGGTTTFVSGPAGAPLGSGSLRLFTTASGTDKATLDKRSTNLGSLDGFVAQYSWYRSSGGPAPAPALKLGIDTGDTNPSSPTAIARGESRFDKILVYEPYLNPLGRVLNDNQWTTETITQSGGKWWLVDLDGNIAGGYGGGGPYQTLSEWLSDPHYGATLGGGIIKSIQLGVGSGNPGHESFVDNLAYSITSGDYVVNFEAAPPATITLVSNACATPGGLLTVSLEMTNAVTNVVGGQFFLQYDDGVLDFVSAVAGDAPLAQTFESVGPGTIDYAVNAPFGNTGSSADSTLAVFTFTITGGEDCSADQLVAFRPHTPPTRLSTFGGSAVNPATVDLAPVSIDASAPMVTCAGDVVVNTDPNLCSAVVGFAAPIVTDNCTAFDAYLEGFESTTFAPGGPVIGNDFSTTHNGWNRFNSNVSRVASGTGGIASKTGGYYGLINSSSLPASPDNYTGLFGRLGGYSSSFGTGFRASVDVYLNTADPAVTANTYGWDLSVAASTPANAHRRDFVFHTAGGAGQILVGADNNSNFARRNDLASINHYVVSSAGWYTFEWVFRDFGDNTLAVDLNLRNASGTLLWTETRHDSSDTIGINVGGNRYMWFTFLDVTTLPIDNTQLTRSLAEEGLVACTPASGTVFSIGTTPVSCQATDACGNNDSCGMQVIVEDHQAPSITCPADVTQPAGSGVCNAVVAIGSPMTGDNCGVDTVGNDHASTTYPEGSTSVLWTVTDIYGNQNTCTQLVTVTDNQSPSITCPANITTNADAGGCDAVVTWTPPNPLDNCGTAGLDLTSTHMPGATFTAGSTTVKYFAEDETSNVTTCSFVVTVDPYNDVQVDVQLSPTIAGASFTRCITFEFDCDGGPAEETVDAALSFGVITNGFASDTIEVACGMYTCITARDRLHTLRRTDGTFHVSSTQYVADFTGADELVGGNLNDDSYIDILDFGTFSFQYLNGLPANTTCSTTGPHSDINGDGIVNAADFTFISNNFLDESEANCCGAVLLATDGQTGPIFDISVVELRQMGMGHLVVADLNSDGRLNEADVVAFAQGARPRRRPAVVRAERDGLSEVQQTSAEDMK
jgi:hypothetical protein